MQIRQLENFLEVVQFKSITKAAEHLFISQQSLSSSISSLEKELVKGIRECGVNVVRLGLVTTPMYYYSWDLLNIKCGMMITASHNPKDDNGFKFSYNGIHNACGKSTMELYDIIISHDFFSNGKLGEVKDVNIREDYLKMITSSIKLGDHKLKVVYDCGNGTTCLVADDIFNQFKDKLELYPLFNTSDSEFPNHHPDPNVAENMIQLQNKVLEIKADIGIAFDGDGDRVGVVNNLGEIVSTEYLMILAIRSLINKTDNKTFLYDVKCSKALEDEIIKLGGTPLCYRTGASYTRYKTNLEKLIFGGEYSGHLYFNERWLGFDSGIYNGLRILEILSNSDLQLSQMFDDVNKYVITPEIKIKVTDESKESIVNNMKKEYIKLGFKINDIDGIKVSYENGWVLLRASNTTPNLTIRIEADTKENQTIINNHFMSLLKKHLD